MVGRISPGAEPRDDPLVEWIQFGTGARSVNVLSQGRCAGEVFWGLVRQFRTTTCLLVIRGLQTELESWSWFSGRRSRSASFIWWQFGVSDVSALCQRSRINSARQRLHLLFPYRTDMLHRLYSIVINYITCLLSAVYAICTAIFLIDIPVAWDSRHACSTCIPTIARAYMMHFFYVQHADPASKFFVFEAQGTRAVRRFKSLAEVAWSQSLKDLEWFNQNEVARAVYVLEILYDIWCIIEISYKDVRHECH